MAPIASNHDRSVDVNRTRRGERVSGREASRRRLDTGVSLPVAAISFWIAIALPALYLPLLFSGIESVEGLAVFLGLFGLHVLALVGGRRHLREGD